MSTIMVIDVTCLVSVLTNSSEVIESFQVSKVYCINIQCFLQTNYTWMQWLTYREKHDNKLLFKCIFMNVQIRVHRRKKKQQHITIRDTKEKS